MLFRPFLHEKRGRAHPHSFSEAVKNCFLRFGQRNCLFPEGPHYSKLRCLKCHVQHYLYYLAHWEFQNSWTSDSFPHDHQVVHQEFDIFLLRRRCRFSCRLQVRLWCWRSWLQPWKDDFRCSRCSSDVQILIKHTKKIYIHNYIFIYTYYIYYIIIIIYI